MMILVCHNIMRIMLSRRPSNTLLEYFFSSDFPEWTSARLHSTWNLDRIFLQNILRTFCEKGSANDEQCIRGPTHIFNIRYAWNIFASII